MMAWQRAVQKKQQRETKPNGEYVVFPYESEQMTEEEWKDVFGGEDKDEEVVK